MIIKKIIVLLSFTLLFVFAPITTKASHLAGGEITYECLGANQYRVNLNLYWDCSGGFFPGTSQIINLSSTCGGSISLTVNQTNDTIGNGQGEDISQMCGSVLSTCNGGTFPGMNKVTYSGIVTLTPVCDTWTMSFSTCCRNTAIDNVSGANYYIEATLNSATAPCNSSPYFTAQPIPYVCTNQPVNYSYGVVEPDGDSLYYSLIDALDAAGVSSTYYAGYSGSQPLPGTTINPNTGLLSFTPTTIGNYVFVILVLEYDDNGNLIGTVMRDIQFVVQNCSNTVPSSTGGTITAFGGNAVQTGPYSLEMCAGNCFNFTSTYSDPDPSDSLSYISNISSALPGSTVTVSGTNPMTLNISWCAPAGSMGQNLTFTITAEDDYCPIPGQQTFAYSVHILDATTASSDITICGSQTAQLNAYGGSIFNWSVVSGPPMTPANFSCNPCANPIASPSATTTYAVVSNLSGTCDNVDTVTVFVVPNFTYTVSQSATSSCLQDPVQLNVNGISPPAAYNYQWSPATALSSATIPNPTATFASPGTYTYTLTVTSPFGCVQTNTLSVVATPSFSPVITASNDTAFCGGGTVILNANFTGSAVPATCGLSSSGGCGGTAVAGTVGTGTTTNTTTSYPAVFSNWYTSVKQQFLFKASELNAAGINGGKIDQLDFPVNVINGVSVYHQFTIRMGCTNITSLGTSWESGLVQVFNPKTVNVVVGANIMLLDNAFEWDGLSNIIVEVCSTEGPGSTSYSNYTQNCESPYTTTAFTSCLYSTTDSYDMCPDLTNFIQTTTNRPNITFHYCSLIPNPANYTFSWTPSSGAIANPNAQNTSAVPPGTMDYYVTVTNNSGGCSDADTVHVDVINLNTLSITAAGPYCVNGGIDTLQVSVPTGTGVWSGYGIMDPVLGVFDPFTAGIGTHQIIYTVSGSCGNAADTISVSVTNTLNATITPIGNQCTSASPVTLTAASPGGVWSGSGITDANAGTFDPAVAAIGFDTITYTITTPCYAQDTVVIHVTSQLDATITPAGPFCTAVSPVILTAVDPGGTWSGPGIINPLTGVFDPATAGPGSHLITYTISGLCGVSDNETINIIPSPNISFSSKVDGCEPDTVAFTSVTDQPGGFNYWDFGDSLNYLSDTSTSAYPTHIYNEAGTYDVMYSYTNTFGCSDTVNSPGYITVYPRPVASFVATPQPSDILSPKITFLDHSTGGVTNWHWTFGVLNDSSLMQSPVYVYPDTGTYPVELIVKTLHGCADTTDNFVIIDPILVFYAPNAFTPNENGNNDVFRVYGEGIERSTFEMQIFNRWGECIFKTNKYDEGWNGARNNTGELEEQDVYIWKVTFKDFADKKHQYIGHVTIVK